MIRSLIVRRKATELLIKNLPILYGGQSQQQQQQHRNIQIALSGKSETKKLECIGTLNNHQSVRYLSRKSSTKKDSKDDNNKKATEDDDDEEDDEEDDDDDEDNKNRPIMLMNFRPGINPLPWDLAMNFYKVFFIIPRIDPNFSLPNFRSGAVHSFRLVSELLADNRIDELDGLVDKKALEEIKSNYAKLSVQDRLKLRVEGDVLRQQNHILKVDIESKREGFTGLNKHIVKILMYFAYIRNPKDVPTKLSEARESFLENSVMCNYEFKREYIDGHQPTDWIITKLIHFGPKDYAKL